MDGIPQNRPERGDTVRPEGATETAAVQATQQPLDQRRNAGWQETTKAEARPKIVAHSVRVASS